MANPYQVISEKRMSTFKEGMKGTATGTTLSNSVSDLLNDNDEDLVFDEGFSLSFGKASGEVEEPTTGPSPADFMRNVLSQRGTPPMEAGQLQASHEVMEPDAAIHEDFKNTLKETGMWAGMITTAAVQGIVQPLLKPLKSMGFDTEKTLNTAMEFYMKNAAPGFEIPNKGVGVEGGATGNIIDDIKNLELQDRDGIPIRDIVAETSSGAGFIGGPATVASKASAAVTAKIASNARPFYQAVLKGMGTGALLGEGEKDKTLESAAMFALFDAIGFTPQGARNVLESKPWRKYTMKERGVMIQSLETTMTRNPEMSEGEILRRWDNPTWRKEALERRMEGEGVITPEAPPITPEFEVPVGEIAPPAKKPRAKAKAKKETPVEKPKPKPIEKVEPEETTKQEEPEVAEEDAKAKLKDGAEKVKEPVKVEETAEEEKLPPITKTPKKIQKEPSVKVDMPESEATAPVKEQKAVDELGLETEIPKAEPVKTRKDAPKPKTTPPLTSLEDVYILGADGTLTKVASHNKIGGKKVGHNEADRASIKRAHKKAGKLLRPGDTIGYLNKKGEFVEKGQVAGAIVGAEKGASVTFEDAVTILEESDAAGGEKRGVSGLKDRLKQEKQEKKTNKQHIEEAKLAEPLTKPQEAEFNQLMKGVRGAARKMSRPNPADFDDMVDAGAIAALKRVRTPAKDRSEKWSPTFGVRSELDKIQGRGMTKSHGEGSKVDVKQYNEAKDAVGMDSPSVSDVEGAEEGEMSTPQDEGRKKSTIESIATLKDMAAKTVEEDVVAEVSNIVGKEMNFFEARDALTVDINDYSGTDLTALMRLRKQFTGMLFRPEVGVNTKNLSEAEKALVITDYAERKAKEDAARKASREGRYTPTSQKEGIQTEVIESREPDPKFKPTSMTKAQKEDMEALKILVGAKTAAGEIINTRVAKDRAALVERVAQPVPAEIGLTSVRTSGVSGPPDSDAALTAVQKERSGDVFASGVKDSLVDTSKTEYIGTPKGNPFKTKKTAKNNLIRLRKADKVGKYSKADVVPVEGGFKIRVPGTADALQRIAPNPGGYEPTTGKRRVRVDEAVNRSKEVREKVSRMEREADLLQKKLTLIEELRAEGHDRATIKKIMEEEKLYVTSSEQAELTRLVEERKRKGKTRVVNLLTKNQKARELEESRKKEAKTILGNERGSIVIPDIIRKMTSKKAVDERMSRVPFHFRFKLQEFGNQLKEFRFLPVNGFFETKNPNTSKWVRVSKEVESKLLNKEGVLERITEPEDIGFILDVGLDNAIKKKEKSLFKTILDNEKGGAEVRLPGREALVQKASNLVKAVKKYSGASAIHDKISVMAPWTRQGFEDIGKSIKNFFAVRVQHESRAQHIATTLVKKVKQAYPDASKEEWQDRMADVVLAAESKKYFASLSEAEKIALRPAVTVIRSYFDNSLAELKAAGFDQTDFVGNRRNKLQERVKTTTDWDVREKSLRELQELNDISFIHIPYSKWFPTNTPKLSALNDKRRASMKALSQKKRYALSVGAVLEKELITRTNIDPVTIIMNYGANIGRDLALAGIKKEAIKAGIVIVKKTKPVTPPDPSNTLANLQDKWVSADDAGRAKLQKKIAEVQANMVSLENAYQQGMDTHWVQFPKGKKYGIFDGTWVDARLRDGIDTAFAIDGSSGVWSSAMAQTKMAQFYNPLFMPMYDIHQALAMSGARPDKIAAGIWKGARDIYTRSQDYELAQSLGVFSQPFANPASDFHARVQDVLQTTGKDGFTGKVLDIMMSRVNRLSGNVKDPIMSLIQGDLKAGDAWRQYRTPVYNMIMDSAWTSAWKMDEVIRMGTFNALRAGGMSAPDAALVAAKVHADYADVPATTRRAANKILFTPTFLISMAKAQAQMATSVLKMATKAGRSSSVSRRMAMGMGAMIGTLIGLDYTMNAFGYKTDQWGRRYTKKIKGQEDIVITLASPVNRLLKYMYWLRDFSNPADTEIGVGRLLDRVKMETGPMIRATIAIADNRRMDGNPVYNKFDDASKQLFDAGVYGFEEMVGLVQVVTGETGRFGSKHPKKRAALEKELNSFVKALSFLQTAHVYVRSGPKVRMARELNRLNSEFGREIFGAEISGREYDARTWKDNYHRRVDAIVTKDKLRRQRERRGR